MRTDIVIFVVEKGTIVARGCRSNDCLYREFHTYILL